MCFVNFIIVSPVLLFLSRLFLQRLQNSTSWQLVAQRFRESVEMSLKTFFGVETSVAVRLLENSL